MSLDIRSYVHTFGLHINYKIGFVQVGIITAGKCHVVILFQCTCCLRWQTFNCIQVLFWGRHIFMGYLGMEDKTKEAFNNEGWFHSGDIGHLDDVSCTV